MDNRIERSMTNHLLGTLLTDWVSAMKILRKVKRWAHLDYSVTVDDLDEEEVRTLLEYLPKKKIGDAKKTGYDCIVRLYGPRLRTSRADTFFVVQLSPDGEPAVSIPLDEKQAYDSANGAQGVKCYVCRVERVIDRLNPH